MFKYKKRKGFILALTIMVLLAISSFSIAMMALTQKNSKIEDPKSTDLYVVGTLCKILQLLKLPDGTLKVLVEGKKRIKIDFFPEEKKTNYLTCKFKVLPNLNASKVDANKINVLQIGRAHV